LKRRRTAGQLLRDYVFYAVVGLLFVSSIFLAADRGWNAKILAPAWFTILLFGLFIAAHRRLLRSRRFWLIWLLFLVLNGLGFVALIAYSPNFSGAWYALLFLVESASFELAVG